MRRIFKKLFGMSKNEQPQPHKLPVIRLEDLEAVADYRRILEEMAAILNRNGYPIEEAMVQDALEALRIDTSTFVGFVTGRSIWGGSGSVSDCNFRGLSAASPAQAQADQKRLDELLSSLARRLVRDGMRNPRIESLGQAYATWAKEEG